jgi:hypothetical protein
MANEIYGKTIASTYEKLLFTISNTGIGSSSTYIATNNDGNDTLYTSPLSLSTSKVGIGTLSPTYLLDVDSGAAHCWVATDTTAVGYDSGYIIGQNGSIKGVVGYDDGNDSVCLVYDTASASTKGINIDSAGSVGIGTATPTAPIHIGSGATGLDIATQNYTVNLILDAESGGNAIGLVGATDLWFMGIANTGLYFGHKSDTTFSNWGSGDDASYQFYCTDGGVFYTHSTATISDIALKKDITDTSFGLSAINSLRPVDYKWNGKSSMKNGVESIGFIAQEVESIIPIAVDGDDWDDAVGTGKGVNTTPIVAALVKAVQELSTKITALENA